MDRKTHGVKPFAATVPTLVCVFLLHSNAALADQGAQSVTPGPAEAAPPVMAPSVGSSGWASTIKLGFQGEAGIIGNTLSPNSHRNFGSLFDDSSNRPVLNQLTASIGRDIDPKATNVDVGFKLQGLYGSDARIIHTQGVFDQVIHDRNQLDIVEADVTVHLPYLFAGGFDVKAGIYPTPLGYEVIDPKANPFYTHSYITYYGLPFKHTGVLVTAHVNDQIDIIGGLDSGTDTFIAYGAGDNNNRPGGIAGISLNMLDGKLTLLAITHMGPEDSKLSVPFANSALRYYNDVVVTYKATDKLTLTGEFNYAREDGFHAEAYGAAGYASYTLTDTVTLNGRAEVFRDNNNFFVSTPVGSLDYINSIRGTFANLITAAKPTTYSEFTAGLTYKLPWLSDKLTTAAFRPEVRYDRALNDSTPFGDGTHRGRVTISGDIILGF